MWKLTFIVLIALQLVAAIDNETKYETLFANCKSGLKNIETIEQMSQFLSLLKSYRDDNLVFRSLMKRCMAEFDSLVELEPLFNVEGDVDECHPSRIRTIVDYSKIQLKSRHSISKSKSKKRMVRHFMRRYALQTALICRKNLIANLQEASLEITANDFNEVFPWRKAAGEKRMIENGSDNNTQVALHQAIGDAEQFFASIKSVDQVIAIMRSGVDISKSHDLAIDPIMHETQDPRMDKLRAKCRQISKYYEGAVMSIVSLASAGYAWHGHKMTQYDPTTDEQRQLLSNWLAATIVCGPMLAYAPPNSEQVEYHQFKRNHVKKSEPFEISDQFVKENALSKSQQFVDKWGYKLARSINKLTTSSSKSGPMNTLIEKLARSLQASTGDTNSKLSSQMRDVLTFVVFVFLIILLMSILHFAGVLG